MKVAIVAGEKSGDYLAADLIKAIRQRYPKAEFKGLCGPLMQQQGAVSLADMDKISIFGLDGLLSSLREILAIRKMLFRSFLEWQPDVFIGVDVPDFNLRLERKLKDHDIPCVHYVSPTVWAWRGGRIKKIRRSIDLMLTLFPFEKKYYQQNNTPVEYVGHPLAKQIMEWQVDLTLFQTLGLNSLDRDSFKLVAVLPGSRMSEVSKLAPIMFDGINRLLQKNINLKFVIPAANQKINDYLKQLPNYRPNQVEIINGQSRDLMALCDFVILASGTAALEAALFAKPMVVMYKVSKLSELVFKNTISVEHYSMPNHLTKTPVVPELIQDAATVDNLVIEVEKLLMDTDYFQNMQKSLAQIAPNLNTNSGELACQAIEELLQKRN
ncbi:UNVERIFIED_CONTAM: hypothetical protein GTU68_032867 [Idotea baltica]|nr:hypothetical protein [Idotea baltica]